jgi:hypothetical protein
MTFKIIAISVIVLITVFYFLGKTWAKGLEDAEKNLHEPMYDNRYEKN